MRILGENCKNLLSGWGLRSTCYYNLLPHKEEKNNYSKCSAFAFFALIVSIFHFDSVVFVEESARIFLAPGRKVP